MTIRMLCLGLGLCLCSRPGLAIPEHPLKPLVFLLGEWSGEGTHPYGSYQETQKATRGVADSVFEVRTKSMMGDRVVHEDLRVFSWDAKTEQLRMRQWTAHGVVRVYTGQVKKDGSAVFVESAHEGRTDERWRYTFLPSKTPGFRYRVDVDRGEGWKPFVSGELSQEAKSPHTVGGLGMRQYTTKIGAMNAQIHHPDGDGPYPVLVFSPGGTADSVQGYAHYGKWWATWGYVTVIVAFNDATATERAPKFKQALDWLEQENTRVGSPLQGKIDAKRMAVGGHSKGGDAALRAARTDSRVRACLALAPSGPMEKIEGKNACPSCIIIGSQDRLLEAATKAHEAGPAERHFIKIDAMSHMLGPRAAALKLVARGTAFLNYALKGDERYRAHLAAEEDGVHVRKARR